MSAASCTSGIYAIVHLDSGRAYVGASGNIPRRWRYHRSLLRVGRHQNAELQRAWSQHGGSTFAFIVVEEARGHTLLLEREQFHISARRTADPEHGFNLAPIAAGNPGKVMGPASPERRAKIGRANRGRTPSVESRQRMALAKSGRTVSAEVREAMRAGQLARRADERTRRPPPIDSRRWRWMTADESAAAIAMYRGGASLSEVASTFGRTKSAIYDRLKKAGTEIRPMHPQTQECIRRRGLTRRRNNLARSLNNADSGEA